MIKRLLYLNGLAVLTVILYHSSAWGFIGMFFWTDRYRPVSVPNFDQLGSIQYFGLRAIEQLIIYGIPTFLFVSGFFIAISTGRIRHTISWKIVLSRVKNLLIPFVIWSLVILTLNYLQGVRYSVPVTLRMIVLGQVTEAYYFVPVLTQLYLLAPFMVPLARDRWKLLLFIAGGLQLIVVLLRYTEILGTSAGPFSFLSFLGNSWFFPGYIFWFALGIVIGFHLERFKSHLFRMRWLFLGGLALFFVIGMVEWEYLLHASGQDWIAPSETLIDNIYAGLFLLTYFGFESARWPLPGQVSNLGVKSYGIYLVHSPVLEYTARIIYHIAPMILAFQLILQPLLWVAGLGIPLLMMAVVNRSPFRRYYQYLFG